MAQRGRKSAAHLALVGVGGVATQHRPEPPGVLSGEEAIIWQDVVDSCPAGWFHPENYPLLVQYCRHVVAADKIQQLIVALERADADGFADLDGATLSRYAALLRMRKIESSQISMLASRMRLSQNATHHSEKTKGDRSSGAEKKPWET